MKALRITDFDAFLAVAEPFFARDEAASTIPLTILASLRHTKVDVASIELWRVDAGSVPVVFAVRTPPFSVVLAHGSIDGVRELARQRATAEQNGSAAVLPGVTGPEAMARAFAETFSQASGRPVREEKRMRLYVLRAVTWPPNPPPGSFRPAGAGDIERLTDWFAAFVEDVGMPSRAPREVIEQGVRSQRLHVWEVEGDVVSMAQRSPTVGTCTRVNLVYTPPARRGLGYASACVAALSQKIVEETRGIACLFTDLDNPTSNAIYQAIGYEPVSDYRELRFADGSDAATRAG